MFHGQLAQSSHGLGQFCSTPSKLRGRIPARESHHNLCFLSAGKALSLRDAAVEFFFACKPDPPSAPNSSAPHLTRATQFPLSQIKVHDTWHDRLGYLIPRTSVCRRRQRGAYGAATASCDWSKAVECFDLVFADDFDAAHTPGTTRTEAWDATMAGRIEKWAKKEGIQPSGPGSTVETTAKVDVHKSQLPKPNSEV